MDFSVCRGTENKFPSTAQKIEQDSGSLLPAFPAWKKVPGLSEKLTALGIMRTPQYRSAVVFEGFQERPLIGQPRKSLGQLYA